MYSELVPGHLHQGGIWIYRGGTNHVVCVCVWGGVRLGSMPSVIACSYWCSLKHWIVFLYALFYRFHFRFRNRSHSARRGEDEKGTVTSLGGGARPANTSPWRWPCMYFRRTMQNLQLLQQHDFVVEESGCWIGLPTGIRKICQRWPQTLQQVATQNFWNSGCNT